MAIVVVAPWVSARQPIRVGWVHWNPLGVNDRLSGSDAAQLRHTVSTIFTDYWGHHVSDALWTLWSSAPGAQEEILQSWNVVRYLALSQRKNADLFWENFELFPFDTTTLSPNLSVRKRFGPSRGQSREGRGMMA